MAREAVCSERAGSFPAAGTDHGQEGDEGRAEDESSHQARNQKIEQKRNVEIKEAAGEVDFAKWLRRAERIESSDPPIEAFRRIQACRQKKTISQGVTARANEIAEAGDVRAVGADAAGIDRKAEAFCEIEIYTRVIEFGEAEARGGRDAIHARGVHGPWRAMTLPGTARQFVKLFPIAFVPTSSHGAMQAPRSFDAVRGKNVPDRLEHSVIPDYAGEAVV